jgi:hypothetical protein
MNPVLIINYCKNIYLIIIKIIGAWFFSYLQSFTRKFSLGGALRYEYSNGLEDAVTTVGGSYKNDDHWQANATFEVT